MYYDVTHRLELLRPVKLDISDQYERTPEQFDS